MNRSRPLPAIVLALTLALAACSGRSSDDAADTTTAKGQPTTSTTLDVVGDTKEAYENAIATLLSRATAGFTPSEAACIGSGIVETLGVEAFEHVGLSSEQLADSEDFPMNLMLDEAQAKQVFAQWDACDVDIADRMLGTFRGQVDDAAYSCFSKVFSDTAAFEAYMLATMRNLPDPGSFEADLMACQSSP